MSEVDVSGKLGVDDTTISKDDKVLKLISKSSSMILQSQTLRTTTNNV